MIKFSLPTVKSKIEPDLRRFYDRIREAFNETAGYLDKRLTDAPENDKVYARKNGRWVESVDTEGKWIDASYENGWLDFGADYGGAQYLKVGNQVHIRGLVASGTIGTNIFTLPLGFRPQARHLFDVQSNGALARVDIRANGTVEAANGSNVWVALYGISFFVN